MDRFWPPLGGRHASLLLLLSDTFVLMLVNGTTQWPAYANSPFSGGYATKTPKGGNGPSWWDILCGVSGTMDWHVLEHFRCALNTVAVMHKFPLFWGLYSKTGGTARVRGYIVRRKWNYALTCSGKFGCCALNTVAVMHKFPFSGVYTPKTGERPELGDILCGVSHTMHWHVRVNFGHCAINTVAMTHNFPFWGDFGPPSGDAWSILSSFIAHMYLHICLNFG